MSVESTVYSPKPPVTLGELVQAGRRIGLELWAFDPDAPAFRPTQGDDALDGATRVVIGCQSDDAETTAAVEDAIRRGDKPAIDGLGQSGKVAWFEFVSEPFDYEASWEDCSDEREEIEDSYEPEILERMRSARVRYQFRCATRPPWNGRLLTTVAELIAAVSDGFVDEP
jgi:hypothetical protein